MFSEWEMLAFNATLIIGRLNSCMKTYFWLSFQIVSVMGSIVSKLLGKNTLSIEFMQLTGNNKD